MYYFIGGTPRVGKTTLATMILERNKIPFIPADVLTHSLDRAYKELGIRVGKWETIPAQFFPYLKEFVRSMTWTLPSYLIEGDSFFPEHIKMLQEEFPIKAVFLGTSKVSLEEIKGFAKHDDWVSGLPEEEQKKLPAELVSMSEMFESESEKYGVSYFDMSENREQKLEEAYVSLFE
jgi:hypothetical protein